VLSYVNRHSPTRQRIAGPRADHPRRHPTDDAVRRNVFRHHGAGADNRALADRHTLEDAHPAADPDVITDDDWTRRLRLQADRYLPSGKPVVLRDHRRPMGHLHEAPNRQAAVAVEEAVLAHGAASTDADALREPYGDVVTEPYPAVDALQEQFQHAVP